jgi:hypothetical protein
MLCQAVHLEDGGKRSSETSGTAHPTTLSNCRRLESSRVLFLVDPCLVEILACGRRSEDRLREGVFVKVETLRVAD